MTITDPTDTALAVIASLHEQSEAHHAPEVADEKPLVPEIVDAAGYSKVGPGPMAAIRFKWTVRHGQDDAYYIDETIGENSTPIISGPMTADAAIRFVDDRAGDAHRRFEELRGELSGRVTAQLMHHDNDEI